MGRNDDSGSAGEVHLLVKAGALLDSLERHGQLTAAELAKELNEPRSSIYRSLATMKSLGWIEPAPKRGGFRLGMRLFRLGNSVAERFDERDAALDLMAQIHEDTQETVFLCSRHDTEAVCIAEIEGRRVKSMALRLGTSLPLNIGAAPRSILAFVSEEFEHEYLQRPLTRFTEHTLADPAPLAASLAETREKGYAVSDQDVVLGMAALGAPIFDHEGQVRGAISCSGPRPTILEGREAANVAAIVDAAKQVSARLGYDDEARWPPSREEYTEFPPESAPAGVR